MNLSRIKVALFFTTLLIAIALLYPRTLFLGYIYEGFRNPESSETYYLDYLKNHPNNKFAVLRLVNLYERMSAPEKATPLLKDLYAHRVGDWEIAMKYLDHLEALGLKDDLLKERRSIALSFLEYNEKNSVKVPNQKIENLLYNAYLQARWEQKLDLAYDLLEDLKKVSPTPSYFSEEQENLDRAQKNTSRLTQRLQEKLKKSPLNHDLRADLANIYGVNGRAQEGRHLIDEGLEKSPNQPTLLKARILFDERLNDREALIQDLEKVLSFSDLSRQQKLEYTRALALEFSKKGLFQKSKELYEDVWNMDPDNKISWQSIISCLLAERHFSKNGDEIERWTHEYIKKFGPDPEQEKALLSMYLYEQKRTDQLPLYEKSIRETRNLPMALDVAYLLIEKNVIEKNDKKLFSWLATMSQIFPAEHRFYLLAAETRSAAEFRHSNNPISEEAFHNYQKAYAIKETPETAFQIALYYFQKKNFRKALPYAEKTLPSLDRWAQKDPTIWWFRRDMAEAYQKKGDWKKSIRVYEFIWSATKNTYNVKDALDELHKKYDSRITTEFQWTDFGADHQWQTKTSSHFQLSNAWSLNSDIAFSHHQAGAGDNSAITGHLLATHEDHNLSLSTGLGFGLSNPRTTLSPFFRVRYEPQNSHYFDISWEQRRLRNDIPVAVQEGVLEDRGEFFGKYEFAKRFTLLGHYQFSRNILPAGELALSHLIEPSLLFTVFEKPFVSIGYQYTFSHVDDRNTFLSKVPLIPDVRAHYLTLFIRHRFSSTLVTEGGAFWGEDTRRKLHFFKGDLWGTNARVTWQIFPWLDYDLAYQYGRESLVSNTANFHQITTSFSGHWF